MKIKNRIAKYIGTGVIAALFAVVAMHADTMFWGTNDIEPITAFYNEADENYYVVVSNGDDPSDVIEGLSMAEALGIYEDLEDQGFDVFNTWE